MPGHASDRLDHHDAREHQADLKAGHRDARRTRELRRCDAARAPGAIQVRAFPWPGPYWTKIRAHGRGGASPAGPSRSIPRARWRRRGRAGIRWSNPVPRRGELQVPDEAATSIPVGAGGRSAFGDARVSPLAGRPGGGRRSGRGSPRSARRKAGDGGRRSTATNTQDGSHPEPSSRRAPSPSTARRARARPPSAASSSGSSSGEEIRGEVGRDRAGACARNVPEVPVQESRDIVDVLGRRTGLL